MGHLSIFIAGNHGGGDETAISKLLLLGDQVPSEDFVAPRPVRLSWKIASCSQINQTGIKRSSEEQAASAKGDWLGGKSLG